jgi:nucleoside-diphosphate-sugar epimerase
MEKPQMTPDSVVIPAQAQPEAGTPSLTTKASDGKILVTGATGLLGSHLLYDLLQKHEKVAALKRPSASLDTLREIFSFYTKDPDQLLDRIEWRTGDLLDKESIIRALEDIDCVINCAAIVSYQKKDRERMITNNVEGTRNLAEAIKIRRQETEDKRQETEDKRQKTIDKRQETGDRRLKTENCGLKTENCRLIHISSIAALGDGPGNSTKFLIDEDTPRDPNRKHNGYSISKYESEKVLTELGLDAIILNPGIILGPGQWSKGSSQLFEKAWQGLKYYPYGGTGYVDVRDVVAIIEQVSGIGYQVSGEPDQVSSLQSSVSSLQSPVFSLQSSVFSLQSPVSSLQSPVSSLQSSVSSLQSPVFSLQSSVPRSSSSFPDLLPRSTRYCVVGANVRYRDFFNMVTDEYGKPNPTIFAGRFMTQVAWRADTLRARLAGRNPVLTRETAAASQRISYYSSAKICSTLNFQFRPIEETIDWIATLYKTGRR